MLYNILCIHIYILLQTSLFLKLLLRFSFDNKRQQEFQSNRAILFCYAVSIVVFVASIESDESIRHGFCQTLTSLAFSGKLFYQTSIFKIFSVMNHFFRPIKTNFGFSASNFGNFFSVLKLVKLRA